MTDKAREQLSALLDGELDAQEMPLLLGRYEKDAAERNRLERYAAIGAAIRNELTTDKPLNIADRVMAEIGDEPLSVSKPRRRFSTAWLKPVAGLAVAASVATVTIVAFGPSEPEPAQPGFLLSSQQLPSLNSPLNNPVAAATLVSTSSQPTRTRDPKLDRYLLTHNERAVITGMQGGVLPYVRIAGFGEDQDKTKKKPEPRQ